VDAGPRLLAKDRAGGMKNLSASPRQEDRDLAGVMRQCVEPPA